MLSLQDVARRLLGDSVKQCRVFVTFEEMDLLDWQHSRPQQCDARADEHGPLRGFQSIDLTFGLATVPGSGDGAKSCLDDAR
jgi:hypothetical protein